MMNRRTSFGAILGWTGRASCAAVVVLGAVIGGCDTKDAEAAREAKAAEEAKSAEGVMKPHPMAGNPTTRTKNSAQVADVHYLGTAKRKTVTEALEKLVGLNDVQVRVLQGILYSHGLEILAPAARGSLTVDGVVASVESHRKEGSTAVYRFKNGVVLRVKADSAHVEIGKESYGSFWMFPLPPAGRLTESQAEDALGKVGKRFGVVLSPPARSTLRSKLTTAGVAFEPKEQVMVGADVFSHATKLAGGGARVELFNGVVLEVSGEGTVLLEYVPWAVE